MYSTWRSTLSLSLSCLLLHLPEPPRGRRPDRLFLGLDAAIKLEQPAGGDRLERVAVLEQIDDGAVVRLEAPLGGLELGPRARAEAGKLHDAAGPGALDLEGDVDAAVQLVHLARD